MKSGKSEEINLNTADFDTLCRLPMVGDKRAQFIMDHRPFESWDDVRSQMPGFSENIIKDLKSSHVIISKK